MPVFWFALSLIQEINIANTVMIFFIIHILVYPSSNGYNSFMDRDSSSIGGVEKPLPPTNQLFVFTVIMDVMAVALSLLISPVTALCIFIYILFSRLYSYRKIRLKQFPIVGYLVVILNQGGLIFYTVYNAANIDVNYTTPVLGVVCAVFLIGGFYPLTQVYQHKEDAADSVKTISMMLGKKGTFIFCGMVNTIAFLMLYFYFLSNGKLLLFNVLAVCFLPVIVYFSVWFYQVKRNENNADFKHTMQMNKIAAICTNLAFITILILNHIG
ncbi:MAG: UbiA prenyltransferase family protein [Bacteroidetes bacterium]|nr:UbiA prenyltransferase family protein [Bacteroidota bacterium]